MPPALARRRKGPADAQHGERVADLREHPVRQRDVQLDGLGAVRVAILLIVLARHVVCRAAPQGPQPQRWVLEHFNVC